MSIEEIRIQIREMGNRYLLAGVLLFGFLFVCIVVCAMHIQFVEGEDWNRWKDKQRLDSLVVEAPRGNIFSDDGALMAASVPMYALYMDFQVYKDPNIKDPAQIEALRLAYHDSLEKYLQPLSERLSALYGDRTPDEYADYLLHGFERGSREFQLSRRKLSYAQYKQVKTFPFFDKGRNSSGLYEKTYTGRQKVFGSLASRTIGDVYGDNGQGKNGLELYYEQELAGKPGLCNRQKVAGHYMDVVVEQPEPGWDLHTTLNLPVQDIVESALRDMLEQCGAESGCAVLMETRTGRVRAISNLGQYYGSYAEVQNYAVSDRSEPGSTFKTVAMMAMLEDGRVRPDDRVDTGNGHYTLPGGRTIHDSHACGELTARGCIAQSSNIGMAKLAMKAYPGRKDARKFVDRIYKMGVCDSLGLEIPGAASPYIPHPVDSVNHRYWSATDLPSMSYGYVAQMPPIYTLAFYNAIANDGCLVRPYFVDRIERDGVVKEKFQPRVIRKKICSDNTLSEIRQMLDSVVLGGTGKTYVNSPLVSIAGKTGTALISKGSAGYRAGRNDYQVSFCGYFPADHPVYSAIVVVRKPEKEVASGARQAGSVFRRIAEQVWSLERRQEVAALEKDTLDFLPDVRVGRARPTGEVLRKMHVSYDMAEPYRDALMKPEPADGRLAFVQREVIQGQVPNVLGLGLRDAVYVLEKAGLQVQATGQGMVVQQSLRAGQKFREGQSISIRLNQ